MDQTPVSIAGVNLTPQQALSSADAFPPTDVLEGHRVCHQARSERRRGCSLAATAAAGVLDGLLTRTPPQQCCCCRWSPVLLFAFQRRVLPSEVEAFEEAAH